MNEAAAEFCAMVSRVDATWPTFLSQSQSALCKTLSTGAIVCFIQFETYDAFSYTTLSTVFIVHSKKLKPQPSACQAVNFPVFIILQHRFPCFCNFGVLKQTHTQQIFLYVFYYEFTIFCHNKNIQTSFYQG